MTAATATGVRSSNVIRNWIRAGRMARFARHFRSIAVRSIFDARGFNLRLIRGLCAQLVNRQELTRTVSSDIRFCRFDGVSLESAF